MKSTKDFLKNIKEFLLDELLFHFALMTFLIGVGVFGVWMLYTTVSGISLFLRENMMIPIILYLVGLYSTFAFTKMVKFKKIQLRANTIITMVVSFLLLFICVAHWWVVPFLALLITLTCIKNKYTGVEIAEIYVTPTVEEKEE